MNLSTGSKIIDKKKSRGLDYDYSMKPNLNNTYIFEKESTGTKNISKNICIEEVTNFKNFKAFYNFSLELYRDNQYCVTPFWKEFKDFFKNNNPFWKHADCALFVVKKNNKVSGRIATIIDHKYCRLVDKKIGYFGFFECIDDYDCAEVLFKKVQTWLLSKNIEILRGPIDGRVDIGCGFLTTGFDSPPSVLSTYNPPYYISFVEKFNMKKSRDFITYYIDLTKPIPKELEKKAKECIKSGVKIRPFNRLRTNKELKWWIKLFLETYEDHWGYTPAPAREVKSRFGIKQLRWFVDSNLFLIAEYKGKPIGYLFSTPEYNQIFIKMKGSLNPFQLLKFLFMKNRINKGKMQFIGIKKEYRNINIGACLNYETIVEMKNKGYIGSEVSLIDEKNTAAHKIISITGAKPYKRYRVFEKTIYKKKSEGA